MFTSLGTINHHLCRTPNLIRINGNSIRLQNVLLALCTTIAARPVITINHVLPLLAVVVIVMVMPRVGEFCT